MFYCDIKKALSLKTIELWFNSVDNFLKLHLPSLLIDDIMIFKPYNSRLHPLPLTCPLRNSGITCADYWLFPVQ